MKRIILSGGFSMGALLLAFAVSGDFRVPEDEFRGWNHVKSMVIFDKRHPLYDPFWGIHHVDVNDRGLRAIKKEGRRKFPDGTVVAIVFYEHKSVDGNTAYVEGTKRLVAFMVKDSSKYRETNGWGYYAYDSKGKSLVKDMARDCHSCHSQVRERDFVFSVWTR